MDGDEKRSDKSGGDDSEMKQISSLQVTKVYVDSLFESWSLFFTRFLPFVAYILDAF